MKPKHQLSEQQRKYYFPAIVHPVLEYYKANQTDLIRDILDAVKVNFTPEFVHQFMKMRFNKGRSTKDLIMPADEWLTRLRAHYMRNYTLDLAPPNEVPITEHEPHHNED